MGISSLPAHRATSAAPAGLAPLPVDASARASAALDGAPVRGLLAEVMSEIVTRSPSIDDIPGSLGTDTLLSLMPHAARPALRALHASFSTGGSLATACEDYFSGEHPDDPSYRLLVELFGPAPTRYATRPERLIFTGVLHRLVEFEPALVAASIGARDSLMADLRAQGYSDAADRLEKDFPHIASTKDVYLRDLARCADIVNAHKQVIAMTLPDFKPSTRVEPRLPGL